MAWPESEAIPSQRRTPLEPGRTASVKTRTELLRIVATAGQTYRENAAGIAAQRIVDWAEAALEEPLSREARDFQAFKHFITGANCTCARIFDRNRYVRAIRLDKADRTAPQFIRRTEAAVARHTGQHTTITGHQFVDRFPTIVTTGCTAGETTCER